MTTLILFLLLSGICGFAFHAIYGRSIQSIPFYLLAAVGGATVGFTLALLFKLSWFTFGGLPVFATLVGAILFLSIMRRIRIEE
ncbi:MAG: hypothetical protein JWP00_3365 [Chloroflexi bacterium]|jgi:uncharacterized membrane protein YeaQ/YmgE (transglycosylase-associated protein family)|nr:hypothetical protein [Chloroflexota bacterium]